MSTEITSAAVVNSTVDGTPIGQTTPAAGYFTTQASSDNSQAAATTAWSKFGLVVSLATTGYIKFPSWLGGFIIQWGQVNTDINGGTLPVVFPLTFPTEAFVVNVTTHSVTDRITYVVYGSLSASGFTIGNNGSSGYAFWIALGN